MYVAAPSRFFWGMVRKVVFFSTDHRFFGSDFSPMKCLSSWRLVPDHYMPNQSSYCTGKRKPDELNTIANIHNFHLFDVFTVFFLASFSDNFKWTPGLNIIM